MRTDILYREGFSVIILTYIVLYQKNSGMLWYRSLKILKIEICLLYKCIMKFLIGKTFFEKGNNTAGSIRQCRKLLLFSCIFQSNKKLIIKILSLIRKYICVLVIMLLELCQKFLACAIILGVSASEKSPSIAVGIVSETLSGRAVIISGVRQEFTGKKKLLSNRITAEV